MTSNILGSFIQIASLPVVILAPLGAVSLLWNALFARLLLRPRMLLGTALIAGGAALIAIYGIVPETTRSLDELMALFARPAFIGWFCAEGFVLLVCLLIVRAWRDILLLY
jgi:magnesium transporter